MSQFTITLNDGTVYEAYKILRIASDTRWGTKRNPELSVHFEWIDKHGTECELGAPMRLVKSIYSH